MTLDELEEHLEAAFGLSPEYGLSELHEKAQDRLLGCIRATAPGLGVADIDDVYQQSLLELLKRARESSFDPSRPLRLAQDIAKKRTIDRCRRRRLRRRREGGEYKDQVIEDMKGTALGAALKIDRIDWAAFDRALWAKIVELPPMQKLAATCFVEVYEDMREHSLASLQEAMSDALGKPVSAVAAKSAWYEAKEKLADHLARKGFNFLREDEQWI